MLTIKELCLENIGCFNCSKQFVFEKGINLINGKNGKGKSTIINTISLLLLNRYTGNLESCLNNKSVKGNAHLTFEVDKDIFVSSIEINKLKSITTVRTLTKNGQLIAEGEDTSKELQKILPISLSEYSLFHKQNGLSIVSISDAERREVLTELVSLNFEQKIKEYIDVSVDTLKKQKELVERQKYFLDNKEYNLLEPKEQKWIWNEDKEKELCQSKILLEQAQKQKELKQKYSDLLTKEQKNEQDFEKNKVELNYTFEQNKEKGVATLLQIEEKLKQVEKTLSSLKLRKVIPFTSTKLAEIKSQIASLQTDNKNIKQQIAEQEYNRDLINKGVCPYKGEAV